MNLHLVSVRKALKSDGWYLDFNARYMNARPHLRPKATARHRKGLCSHRYTSLVSMTIDKKSRIRWQDAFDSRKIEPQFDKWDGTQRRAKRKEYKADRRVRI